MKNIIKSVVILFGALVASCSTDDVQDRPIIQGKDAPVLSAPTDGSSYILLPENMTAQAERFVWTSANYNGAVEINYVLQMDVEGGDFSNPQVIGGANSANQSSVSVETLNTAALALGATPYTISSFDVRVVSSANGFDSMASNVITISITPYTTETPKLWLPGSYQADSGYGSDWNHSGAPQLASEGFGNTNFEGYVYFATTEVSPSDGFKFTDAADWNNGIFGDNGDFSGILASPGDNIGVNAGYYRIQANTTSLTYTLQSTIWAVTGSATSLGWPAGPDGTDGQDVDMTYNPSTKKWEVITTLTGGQEIKFRANNAWSLNYGDDGTDGSLNEGGANIPVATTGSYLVELDLSNPRAYTYTLTPQ